MHQQQSAAPVGPYLADQLMIPAALVAAGIGCSRAQSEFWATELTEHARTNARVIEQFLPVDFELENGRVRVMSRPTGFNPHDTY
jgi:RNA 3'-terminal phosphate cyclase (ATP)